MWNIESYHILTKGSLWWNTSNYHSTVVSKNIGQVLGMPLHWKPRVVMTPTLSSPRWSLWWQLAGITLMTNLALRPFSIVGITHGLVNIRITNAIHWHSQRFLESESLSYYRVLNTGLKLENYYFFTFTFSRPEVRKLLLFYVFTFSRPEVRKLFRIYFFTFSRPEVRKLFRIYFFTFSRPEVRKLFRIYVFIFSRPEVGKLFRTFSFFLNLKLENYSIFRWRSATLQ